MTLLWQISAGEFFELLRPAAWIVSALISTWTLASARRLQFASYAIIAWTLGTLFFPLIVFPIFLIVRASRRRKISVEAQRTTNRDSANEGNGEGEESQQIETSASARSAPLKYKFLLPIFYLVAILSLRALFYYHDFQSVDAHLARANQARLMNRREKTILEYRAALRLEDNPHTHNLLARELLDAGMREEALAEFRAAERGGEPDDELSFHIANTLDALNRHDEAAPEYEKFLSSPRCHRTQGFPEPLCATARARIGNQMRQSLR